jgi:hypothetical protein
LTPSPVVRDFETLWIDLSASWLDFSAPARRYLAARLFASWIPYYSRGLRTLVEGLRTHLAVLQMESLRQYQRAGGFARDQFVEAVRQTDLLMVHFSDARALTKSIETGVA